MTLTAFYWSFPGNTKPLVKITPSQARASLFDLGLDISRERPQKRLVLLYETSCVSYTEHFRQIAAALKLGLYACHVQDSLDKLNLF